MSKGAKLALALCLLAAAGLLAAASLPPGWISWQEKQLPRQSGQPALMLRDKALWAELDGEWTRQTGPELLVQDVLRCDIDRDGAPELLLLCWKRGRYGQSRPFWVEEDPPGWSQHIFIYRWTGQSLRPLWMASELGREVVQWRFDETERLQITDRRGQTTAWDWVSWGLSCIGEAA